MKKLFLLIYFMTPLAVVAVDDVFLALFLLYVILLALCYGMEMYIKKHEDVFQQGIHLLIYMPPLVFYIIAIRILAKG